MEHREPFIIDSHIDDGAFQVYWNAPTFQCKSRVSFTNITEKYGIIQNTNDSFRGNKIALLYDPGNFPALLKDGNQPDYVYRNGGVPQEGDLDLHLQQFKEDLEKLVPDELFNGLGIIDFESWRPIFRQHWGSLAPYKEISYEIERKKDNTLPQNSIEKIAAERFEETGKKYVEQTMALARNMRSLAKWGYYAYPYSFNMNTNTKIPTCSEKVQEENDSIQWLWDQSDLLLPSVYLPKNGLDSCERTQLIKGRVEEAKRLQAKTDGDKRIYPYLWYKYTDTDDFLTKEDLFNAIHYMKDCGLNGVIIWGSSNDVNTKEKCIGLQEYVENVLGPTVQEILQ